MRNSASEIRKSNLELYQRQAEQTRPYLLRHKTTDAQNNLKAYEQMTNAQILLSEERKNNSRQKDLVAFLTTLDKSEEQALKSKIVFKSEVA